MSIDRSRSARAPRRARTSGVSGRFTRMISGNSMRIDSASFNRCWRLLSRLRRALCHKAISSVVSSGPASPAARLNAPGQVGVGLDLTGDADRVQGVGLALPPAP